MLKAPNFEWKTSDLMWEFTRNRSSEWMAGFIPRRLLVASTHQPLFSSMKGDLEKVPDSDVSLTPWHGGYEVVLVSGGSFRFPLALAHLFGIVDRDHALTPGFRDGRFQIAGAFVTWMKQLGLRWNFRYCQPIKTALEQKNILILGGFLWVPICSR